MCRWPGNETAHDAFIPRWTSFATFLRCHTATTSLQYGRSCCLMENTNFCQTREGRGSVRGGGQWGRASKGGWCKLTTLWLAMMYCNSYPGVQDPMRCQGGMHKTGTPLIHASAKRRHFLTAVQKFNCRQLSQWMNQFYFIEGWVEITHASLCFMRVWCV